MWERGEEPIICAIVGTKIYETLGNKVDRLANEIVERISENKK